MSDSEELVMFVTVDGDRTVRIILRSVQDGRV